MSIVRKVKAVEQLFNTLQDEINQFRDVTQLSCLTGCGKCCNKPDINASPLEFLPWAFQVFINGKSAEYLEKLENDKSGICLIYQPLSIVSNNNGKCSDYVYRGLICRLFGYGARRDKLNQLKMVSCRQIKESQTEEFQKAEAAINEVLSITIFTAYYMKLTRIDFRLANTIVPINRAMKIALEEVLHYYAYRPLPKKNGHSA